MPFATRYIVWLVVCGVRVASAGKCPQAESVNITEGERTADGRILYAGVVYDGSNYFVDGNDYWGCVCRIRQCIPVCCMHANNSGLSGSSEHCAVNALTVNVSRSFNYTSGGYDAVNLFDDPRFWVVYEMPECPIKLSLEQHEYTLDPKGRLVYDLARIYDRRTYCVNNEHEDKQLPYVVLCAETDTGKHTIYAIGLILSIPFLLATLIVYALLPELRNVPGKSLMWYVFGLTVSYTILTMLNLGEFYLGSLSCAVAGYICYFAFLLSSFWLNAMALDIYWTFSDRYGQSSDRRKFLLLSAYACGVPTLLLTLVLVVDHTTLIDEDLRPLFGTDRCLFRNTRPVGFLYLYLPLLLMVSANVFFFVATAVRIRRLQRTMAAHMGSESRRHSRCDRDRVRFGLYLRLFIIMGVTWMFEFFTWVFNDDTWLVYMVDICNCINGVFIFLLFVWKRKVRKLLKKRIYSMCGRTSEAVTQRSLSLGRSLTTVDNSMANINHGK